VKKMAKKGTSKSRGMEVPASQGSSVSMRVEPITNGFLITRTTMTPKGYNETREFSKTKPKMPKV
jgi:uncharacterized protein YgiB involved in biofilm formation